MRKIVAVLLIGALRLYAEETPAVPIGPGENPPKPLTAQEEAEKSKLPAGGDSLNVDEPDFKATVYAPNASIEPKPANPATAKGGQWAIATEEGTEPGTKAETPAATGLQKPESKEEISAALARAISKEHGGRTPREMMAAYQEVVAAEPDNAPAHYRLGMAQAKDGEVLKGLASLEKALTLSPGVPKYQCDYGLVLLQAGWIEKALLATNSAVRGASGNARYQSALGDCFLAANRVTQASAAYAQAVRLDPNNSLYIYNLGIAYLHGRSYKKAMDLFEEAIRMRPEHSPFYCGRGLAQESNGNIKEGIKDYLNAVRLNPNNAYAHYLLACVFSDPDDPTYVNRFESVEHADLAVKLTHAHNAQYLMGLARALSVARRYAEAADAARKAVVIDPNERNKKLLANYEQKVKTDGF